MRTSFSFICLTLFLRPYILLLFWYKSFKVNLDNFFCSFGEAFPCKANVLPLNHSTSSWLFWSRDSPCSSSMYCIYSVALPSLKFFGPVASSSQVLETGMHHHIQQMIAFCKSVQSREIYKPSIQKLIQSVDHFAENTNRKWKKTINTQCLLPVM